MAKTTFRSWNTNEIKTLIHGAAMDASKKVADHLLEEAKKIVPVDPGPGGGTLRDSGKVDPTPSGYIVRFSAKVKRKTKYMKNLSKREIKKAASVGIDAEEFDYAIIQHEETEFHHEGNRSHHYLKIPLERNKEMYQQWIAEAVDEKL